MRILEVVADGRPGGGTTAVLTLLEHLCGQTPHEVHFVSQEGTYALARAAALGAGTHGVDFGAGRFDRRSWRRLAGIVSDLKPDLIHAHGARAGLPLAYHCRKPGQAPLVYTVHGYHFPHKPWGLRHLAALAERRCHRSAAATVWVSAHDRDLAGRWRLMPPGRAGHVIYNGIDLDDLPRAGQPDPRLVVFLGRLQYQKQPELLVDMMAHLAPEGFRLRYVGGGELEAAVRARARALGVDAAVEITGPLDRPEALKALAGAGCMVLPSRWEGLPIAPIEAMAIGVPVIASRRGGTPEVIGEDGGVLIDRQEPELYAEAVRRLCHEPDRRCALVRAARGRVDRLFRCEAMIDRYIALYESTVPSRDA